MTDEVRAGRFGMAMKAKIVAVDQRLIDSVLSLVLCCLRKAGGER